MVDRRPRVSPDGTIRYGVSKEEARIIELNGLNPDKAIVIKSDSENLFVMIDNSYYLLRKRSDT